MSEWRAADETQGPTKVVQAGRTSRLTPRAEATEQVRVDQKVFDLISSSSSDARCCGLAAVGHVRTAGARVDAQPGAEGEDVLADASGGDAHGVGDFLSGSAVRAGGQEREQFAEVGFAVHGCGWRPGGGDPDGEGTQQHQLGQVAARIEPRADVVVEGRVVLFNQLADALGGRGRSGRQE